MKSFITFLLETDLNWFQQNLVRNSYSGREWISPRTVHDPDYHPVGVGTHHTKSSPQPTRGPINLPDYGGEFGKHIDDYSKAKKHELSKHVFDPSNPDIPGSVHHGSLHSNTVRIIPFEVQKTEPHPDLIKHLSDHGYDIHDFENGLAIKRGGKNPQKIGKILGKTKPEDPNTLPRRRSSRSQYPEGHPLKGIEPVDPKLHETWQNASTHFERSRELHSLTKTHEIMISKDPFHIAEQSTGKKTWGSCIRLPDNSDDSGGCNHRFLAGDILGGTHAAYLIPKGSYNPHKPLKAVARMTLRQYSSEDGDHSVLRPAGIVYGYHPRHPVSRAFASSLSSFTERHFPFDKNVSGYHVESSSPDGQSIYTDSFTAKYIHNPNNNNSPRSEEEKESIGTETSIKPKPSSSSPPTQKLKGGLE